MNSNTKKCAMLVARKLHKTYQERRRLDRQKVGSWFIHWYSMNSLQRSEHSFRRQGSSGRIWENNHFHHQPKPGELQNPGKVQESRFSKELNNIENMVPQQPCIALQPAPTGKQRDQPRCYCLTFLGRCGGSPAS